MTSVLRKGTMKMNRGLMIIVAVVQLVFYCSPAFSEEAAPYTAGAYLSVIAAAQQVPPLPYSDSNFSEERAFQHLEKMREIFKAAGYNYDLTLINVSKDIKDSNNLKDKIATVAGMIVAGVQVMMTECGNQRVDCLGKYPTGIADAMRTISGNSKLSL